MKSFIIISFLLAAGALCPVKAEQNIRDIPTNILVQLQLRNNSVIIGRAVAANLPFESSIASINLLWDLIDSIHFDKKDLATVNFLSGECLNGKITASTVEIESLVGRLRVPIQALLEITVITPGKTAAELKEGLLFYYSFDQNEYTKITDDSGNGRHGIVEGATWLPDGFSEGSRSFTGDPSRVRIPNSPALNVQVFTFSAWVTTTNMPTKDYAGICGKKNENSSRNSFRMFVDAQASLNFTIYGEHHAAATILTDPEPIRNKWGLIAVTYDGAMIRMFINGKATGEAVSANVKYTGNEYDFLLGASEFSANQGKVRGSWLGNIDEVRFYNRALTAKEIQRLFSGDILRYKACLYKILQKTDSLPAKTVLQATVDLNDRSKLKGTPSLSKITLQTDDLGDILVPLPYLSSIYRAGADDQVIITLRNGDILSGRMQMKDFDLAVIFGKVSIPFEKVSFITIGDTALPPLPGRILKPMAPISPPPAKQVDENEIYALIEDLQSPNDSQRQKAARRLVQIGTQALPALQKLLKETDGDIRWLVGAVIQEIENNKGDKVP